jgi:hypothetical protein
LHFARRSTLRDGPGRDDATPSVVARIDGTRIAILAALRRGLARMVREVAGVGDAGVEQETVPVVVARHRDAAQERDRREQERQQETAEGLPRAAT